MHNSHLNINSLPKIDEVRFIAKQLNASIVGINESKLDLSILHSKLDTDEYDLIDWTAQGGEAELYVVLEGPYLITIRQVFVVTLKAFLLAFSCPSPNQFS